MKNALVLMTALIPTTGHADLVKFAANLPETKVHVLINGRSFEPYSTEDRAADLSRHFDQYENVQINYSIVDDAPQNPEDMPEGFWKWWKNEVNRNFPAVKGEWNYVVASEPYGANVASTLDAEFLSYDLERVLNRARGAVVRSNLWGNWKEIIPETRQNLQLKAVMFGQESVGKTTISKAVSESLNADWIPEYARPYLETVGSEITDQKMLNIYAGQSALQLKAYKESRRPALIMDTDLFSTVGYYEIMHVESKPEGLITNAKALAGDIYYLLPDDVPFEVDPLRYGGDTRESDMKLWEDLLKEFNLDFVEVPRGDLNFKVKWICDDIRRRFEDRVKNIKEFERD